MHAKVCNGNSLCVCLGRKAKYLWIEKGRNEIPIKLQSSSVPFSKWGPKFVLSTPNYTLLKFEDGLTTCKRHFTNCLLNYRSTEPKYCSTKYEFLICSVSKG